MPVKVEKRIGKLRRGFLWQGNREELGQVEHYQCKERRVAHQEIISTEQEPFDEMALEI